MIQRLKKRNFLFKAALVAAVLYGASAPSLFAASAQVGFSPEGTAQQLVINVIGSAKDNIRMMAYSFTAPRYYESADCGQTPRCRRENCR